MVFTTEGILEAAIESWPEWDSNPRPLNFVYVYIYIEREREREREIDIDIYIYTYIFQYKKCYQRQLLNNQRSIITL